MHKAGFVNIIGSPNVGKSTLMNRMTGEKLSIITPKAQTTRHRIMGILSGENYQIVFSDTPGILSPKYKLQEIMLKYVEDALGDADVFLFVTDPHDSEKINEQYVEKINFLNVPTIVIINKIDTIQQEVAQQLVDKWKALIPKAEVLPVSALHNFNIESVLNSIISKLPDADPYFDKETLTDRPMRFFVAEIIREKIFLYYQKEIPYSTQVVVDAFKEYPEITKIAVTIYVERESQKPILIGNKGLALKKVGVEARKEIEKFLGVKVYLEMFVKVDEDWRKSLSKLKRFGFDV